MSLASASTLWIVPSQRHVDELALRGEMAWSLRALVQHCVRDRYATEPATPEMTRMAAASVSDRGGSIARAVETVIGALVRSGAPPAQVEATGERGAEIAAVWRDMHQLLASQGLRDRRSDTWLAASAASALPNWVRAIQFRGACGLQPDELALVEALHAELLERGGKGVTVEIPRDGQPAADRWATELENHWASAPSPPTLCFAGRIAEPRLCEAHNADAEARRVAAIVLRAIDSGVAPERVAIAPVRLTEAFLEPLRSALHAGRIPFTEPRGRPPLAAPRTFAALALMRLVRGPITRDGIVDVLRAPDADYQRWTGSRDVGSRLRLARAVASLSTTVDRDGRQLERELSARGTQHARTATQQLGRMLADVRALTRPSPRAAMTTAWQALLADVGLLENHRSTSRALDLADSGNRHLLRVLGDEASGARALSTAFDRIADAATALGLQDETITAAVLSDEVETAVGGLGVARGAARAGAVRIGRPAELAGLTLDLAVICRASSAMDRVTERAEQLLGETIRALPKGRRPWGSTEIRRAQQLALEWLLATTTTCHVTWARQDERGGADSPSRWALALRARATDVGREPGSVLDAAASRLAPRQPPGLETLRRARIERQRHEFFMNPESPGGPDHGSAGDLSAWVGGGSPDTPVTVTLLERFLRCPFLGFVGGALRASRTELKGEALGIRERGVLFHAGLHAAMTATSGLWGTRTAEELEELAMHAARAKLLTDAESALRQASVRATLDDIAAVVRWSVREQAAVHFLVGEQAFGSDEVWPALELQSGFCAGRIDRIDASSDGLRIRVVDYKSGGRPTKQELSQQLLQPWLYAVAAARSMNARDVESGYLYLQKRRPEFRAVTANLRDDATTDAIARANRALQTLHAGQVEPRPQSAKHCPRCDARDICRRPLSAPAIDRSNA